MPSLNPKLSSVVRGEIQTWQAEGLIQSDLASCLLERYPEAGPSSLHITVLTTVGAILLGLGGLLYVASNWEQTPAFLKIALIVSTMLGSYFFGWRLRYEPGTRPRVGSALMLLGSIIFGAGIWLVSQIFNMDMPLESGLLLWSVGVGLMALITRCGAQATLTSVLVFLNAFAFDQLNWWDSSWQGAASTLAVRGIIAFAVSAAIAYHARSRAAFAIATVASCVPIGMFNQNLALIPWGATLFSGYMLSKNRLHTGPDSLMYVGAACVLFGYLPMTFSHETTITVSNTLPAIAFPLLAVAAGATVAVRRPELRTEGLVCAVLAVIPYLVMPLPAAIAAGIANIVLFTTLLAGIVVSNRKLQEPGLVNLSIGVLVIFLMCRYFDWFYSLLDRSLAFTLGGVLLLTIGSIAERTRRKLLGGMN